MAYYIGYLLLSNASCTLLISGLCKIGVKRGIALYSFQLFLGKYKSILKLYGYDLIVVPN